MLSLPIAACILGACLLLGAQALALLRLFPPDEDSLPTAERALFSLAAGMLPMALLVLAVGLAGVLRPWVLYLVVLTSIAAGARQMPFLWKVLASAVDAVRRGLSRASERRALHAFLALWAVLALLGALAPPGDLDYDGLSQHLAAPKVYLRHGRIEPLWYDHHSQFPSALQMLFTIGLAAHSAETAKVLHWACGVLAAVTLIVAGRRFLSPAAGEWAAFALLVTPLVGWLGSVAYVDLASVFFAALLLLAFLRWLSPLLKRGAQEGRDIALVALAAGGGMAVKMQGLQVFGVALLLILVALYWARANPSAIARQVGLFLLVATVPAAPWYVKSLVWTGNPVYPFAYGVFGGKYWGPGEAAAYHEHQAGFGVGEPPPPAERARMGLLRSTFSGPRKPLNLLLAPWNLTMRPAEFDVLHIAPLYAITSAAIGPLLLAMLPLLLLTGAPPPVRWSLALFALLWLAWLMLMQYNRYLVPALPFAVLPVGHVLGDGLPPRGVLRYSARGVAWACGALALLYLGLNGWLTGSWAAGIGLVPRDVHLQVHSEAYRFADWVNKVTPPGSTIALYSEPRGFYLDREYLWADPGHSRLIEYDQIKSPEDLLDACSRLGITHVLYHKLAGGAPNLLAIEPHGTALRELLGRGEVSIVGHPPQDPTYVLLAIETPWARELAR